MIWFRGEIVSDESLTISVLDRTFEHGLGLFETLRTWNKHPTLLGHHRNRLAKAAFELDIPLDVKWLPDNAAVANLLEANGHDGDAMLRITASGGSAENGSSVVWMRSFRLPPPIDPDGWSADIGYWDVDMTDPLARYKSLNYWERRIASERARARGFDETLSQSPTGSTMQGALWEGSRSNLFVGIDDRLLTPAVGDEEPIVPGIMRGLVLARAQALGIRAITVPITEEILERATEAFLTNSLRGIVPLKKLGDREFRGGPGRLASRLWSDILPWLEAGFPEPVE